MRSSASEEPQVTKEPQGMQPLVLKVLLELRVQRVVEDQLVLKDLLDQQESHQDL